MSSESLGGVVITGAAQGIGIHVRGQGLDHRHGLDQFGRQHIHGHGAGVPFRRRQQGAVDGHRVQTGAQAARERVEVPAARKEDPRTWKGGIEYVEIPYVRSVVDVYTSKSLGANCPILDRR